MSRTRTSRAYRCLHVDLAEWNLSHYSNLQFGTAALAMNHQVATAAGSGAAGVRLSDPVAAMHAVSHDGRCRPAAAGAAPRRPRRIWCPRAGWRAPCRFTARLLRGLPAAEESNSRVWMRDRADPQPVVGPDVLKPTPLRYGSSDCGGACAGARLYRSGRRLCELC